MFGTDWERFADWDEMTCGSVVSSFTGLCLPLTFPLPFPCFVSVVWTSGPSPRSGNSHFLLFWSRRSWHNLVALASTYACTWSESLKRSPFLSARMVETFASMISSSNLSGFPLPPLIVHSFVLCSCCSSKYDYFLFLPPCTDG